MSYELPIFFKMFKTLCRFQKLERNSENIFGFLNNCIWIACSNFCLLWQEYFSLAVNVITNSSKISDLTKRDVFQFNISQIDETIGWKCCRQVSAVFGTRLHVACSRVSWNAVFQAFKWPRFPRVYNFRITWPLRLIFFFKMLKIWGRSQKCKKRFIKDFWVFR